MAAQQVQEYLERHRIGALFEVTMYIFTRFIPTPIFDQNFELNK